MIFWIIRFAAAICHFPRSHAFGNASTIEVYVFKEELVFINPTSKHDGMIGFAIEVFQDNLIAVF